jgi:hypothetical protein
MEQLSPWTQCTAKSSMSNLIRRTTTSLLRARCVVVGLVLAGFSACSDEEPTIIMEPSCLDVAGHGETVGTIRTLMGTGMFSFDGTMRPADVGIYLNDIVENPDGSWDLTVIYQFFWDNGDFLLTQDPVRFTPSLEADMFDFSVILTVSSGAGLFDGRVGETPFRLNASIEFGPPPAAGELKTAREEFTVGGRLCAS